MKSKKRLIDANLVKEKAVPHYFDNCCYAVSVKDIDDAPTVDAVEVVRCKGCKHWTDALPDCTEHKKFCEIGFYMIDADGFCSLGERREGE